MKHWLTIFLCAVTPSLGHSAPEMVSSEIAWLEIGIICAPDATGSRPAPDTVAGATHVIDDSPPFVSHSQTVPAAYGVGFGVRSLARHADGLDDVTIAITHPPMGDGGTTQQSFVTRIAGLDPSISFYQFDYDYERIPGLWTVTALRNDKPLYVVQFNVVRPETVPELAGVCNYLDMLS